VWPTTPHHKKIVVTEPQEKKRGGQRPIWAVGPLDGWMDKEMGFEVVSWMKYPVASFVISVLKLRVLLPELER
jgi:hypothetical protein